MGESTDEQARGSLRRALNNLRQQLGADALFADRETVQFNPDFPLWCDAVEFKKPDAESKIQNYSGELLSDFYDDWIFPLREGYRAQYLDALVHSIEHARAASEYTQAIALAQKILAIDRAHEEAHQHLMFCYAALGNRGAALEQYEACRTALREELGVEPSKETGALYASILKKEETGSRAARLTNLPKPLTSFVGREQQLAELGQLTLTSRLVTLTGAGGSGKTRLAIQIGHQLYEQYADGVWFVDFAPLTDSELVPQQVAKTLSVQEQPQRAVTETLIQFLENKSLLLILDNCEHLVHACAILAETLVTQCPMLHLLATSREPLGIGGEMVWRVPTLEVPPAQGFTEWLMQYEAVRLFVERARAVNPRFALDEQNAAAIAHISQRLDGIPLAIELAAARTNVLRPDQIAARLDDRFGLLTSGSRTALPRQQTLRALIDWSYDLLDENEKILFRRLSVFAGGWALEAAQWVAGDGGRGTGIVRTDPHPLTPNALFRLVDKSLVVVEESNIEKRFRMLDTIREYAFEKLHAPNETDSLRTRHLDFFVSFAERAEPELKRVQQLEWLERLDTEIDNFRTALAWSLSEGRVAQGLRLAGALLRFWDARGYWSEGLEWVERLLIQPEAASRTLTRANGLLTAGELAGSLGASKQAIQYLEELIGIARELGALGKRTLALGLASLSDRIFIEDPDAAESLVEEGLTIARSTGDEWLIGALLFQKGFLLTGRKDDRAAREALEESLRLFKSTGDVHGAAAASFHTGRIYFRQGDWARARREREESLPFLRQAKDRRYVCYALNALGEIARAEGNYELAKGFYEEAFRFARELGGKFYMSITTMNVGYVALYEGKLAFAKALFVESLEMARDVEYGGSVAAALLGFAGVAAAEMNSRRAVRLLAVVETLLRTEDTRIISPADEVEYQRHLAFARKQLDDAAFSAAWEDGRAMTLEQAIEYALSDET